jgi:hypothetical protein
VMIDDNCRWLSSLFLDYHQWLAGDTSSPYSPSSPQ